MDWMIQWSSLLLLTSLTGAILLSVWYLAGVFLERLGLIHMLYWFLRMVMVFFLIPVAYLVLCALDSQRIYGDGCLFNITSGLMKLGHVLVLIWAVGFLVVFSKNVLKSGIVRYHYRGGFPCKNACRNAIFQQVCSELGIAEGTVKLFESYHAISPYQIGILEKRIYLPVKELSEKELRIIFFHELTHCRQNDLFWKALAGLIVSVHWFNPAAWWLRNGVDCWSEYNCDYEVYRLAGGIKSYFSVVQEVNERCSMEAKRSLMMMAKNQTEIEGRVKHLLKCRRKTKLSKRKMTVITMMLLVISLVSVVLTSAAFAEGYVVVYNETKTEEEYDCEPCVLTEYELYVEEASEVTAPVKIGDLCAAYASMPSGTFNWNVDSGWIVNSSDIYLESGTSMTLTCTIIPSDVTIKFGLIIPTGQYWYVRGNNIIQYTFPITVTGLHRIYVENISDTDIAVAGTYINQ